MQNRKQEAIDVARGNGHIVYLPIPESVDLDYALLMRNLPEKTTTRQPYAQEAAEK